MCWPEFSPLPLRLISYHLISSRVITSSNSNNLISSYIQICLLNHPLRLQTLQGKGSAAGILQQFSRPQNACADRITTQCFESTILEILACQNGSATPTLLGSLLGTHHISAESDFIRADEKLYNSNSLPQYTRNNSGPYNPRNLGPYNPR